ncbi:MAG: hypothetical protein ABR961_15750 [Thermoanaerobaculaceae bacterium]
MQILLEVAMGHSHERGSNSIGCFLGLALVIVVVFIGVKAVPTRLSVAELQDFCEREGEQASLPRFGDERIADAIFGKAIEEHLPVKKEDIKVSRDQTEVHIEVRYRVVIDFLVYQYNWDVEHKVDRTLF